MTAGLYRSLTLAAWLVASPAWAQDLPSAPATTPDQPRFEDTVEVVGVTPIHGVGLPAAKVPSNVQTLTPAAGPLAVDVPSGLSRGAASVQLSDAHGGTFQPDVHFRGFGASPLLGAPEGLAVYQDGVRVNEPFGDTVNWDLLPSTAIASVAVMPGSNPMFGLNALGGALSIRTKTGFTWQGRRASVSGGSFGRGRADVEVGGHGATFAYYTAAEIVSESGWRERSPSTTRRLFADLGWRRSAAFVNVSLTAASNDLSGSGSVPPALLEEDRSAVFTYPDRTQNDLVLATVRGGRPIARAAFLEAVAYVRANTIATLNGDAADEDDDETESRVPNPESGSGSTPYDAINNLGRTRGRSAGGMAQLTHTAPLFSRDSHLVAGASLDAGLARFASVVELARLSPDRGTIASGIFVDDEAVGVHTRTVNGSLFALETWSLTPAIAITGSARVNWTTVRLRDRIGDDLDGDHAFVRLNPSAGATWQATPALNVYGSYAEASRVPTPVELTCADPEDPCRLPNAFLSDPPLDQVVTRTWEGGVRGAARRVQWTTAAFATDARADIIFISSGTRRGEGHFANVDSTRRRGVEISAQVTLPGVGLFAAYTAQRATFGEALRLPSRHHPRAADFEIGVARGDRLPAIPVHTAKGGVTLTRGRLAAGADVRFQSGQFLRGDESNELEPLPGFAVADAQARYRLTPRLGLLFTVANVFDADAFSFGTLGDASLVGEDDDPRFVSPGAPRAAWVGVDFTF